MFKNLIASVLLVLFALLCPVSEAQTPKPVDPGWPRSFSKDGTTILLHQPQIDSWKNYTTMRFRCALEITLQGAATPEMGVMADYDTSAEVRKELDRLQARCANQVRCEVMMRNGTAESEIIKVARELASDLIILSTHGRTGLERLLLGSTVEKVVRRAGCPIFIVRPHEHDFIPSGAADGAEGHANEDAKYEAAMKASL